MQMCVLISSCPTRVGPLPLVISVLPTLPLVLPQFAPREVYAALTGRRCFCAVGLHRHSAMSLDSQIKAARRGQQRAIGPCGAWSVEM